MDWLAPDLPLQRGDAPLVILNLRARRTLLPEQVTHLENGAGHPDELGGEAYLALCLPPHELLARLA